MAAVSFSTQADTLYAHISGEIDHDTAQTLRQRIDDVALTRMPRVLVLDLTQVGFMDSSGVGLILGRRRRMQALGGVVRVQQPPAQIRKVLDLAQIEYQEVIP